MLSINRQEVNSRADVERVESTIKAGLPVEFRILRRANGPNGQNGQWVPMFLAGMLPNTGQ